MHRGRIEAESEPSLGSQFTLFLPSATRLLRSTLLELSRKEKPEDQIAKAAAATLRDWASEVEGVRRGDGLFNVRSLLDIIDEKVDNSVNITHLE